MEKGPRLPNNNYLGTMPGQANTATETLFNRMILTTMGWSLCGKSRLVALHRHVAVLFPKMHAQPISPRRRVRRLAKPSPHNLVGDHSPASFIGFHCDPLECMLPSSLPLLS